MKLNIISRIAADKDFFTTSLNTLSLLRKNHNISFELNFIGPIESHLVYERIIDKAKKLNILDLIYFSKKSISYNELPNSAEDFYLNFSNGDVVGYSSIECIEKEFKTIFLNINGQAIINNNFKSFCENELQFYNLLMNLNINSNFVQLIEAENKELVSNFFLNDSDKKTLKNILNGV